MGRANFKTVASIKGRTVGKVRRHIGTTGTRKLTTVKPV